jgi:WD40 repeat protein
VLRFPREIFNSQLSPDGRWLSVVLVDRDWGSGDVEIWHPRARRRVHNLPSDGPVTTRFSPDSKLLTVGTRTRGTRVWSTETWRPVTRFLAGDATGVLAAVISPGGRTLATGLYNGTVRLWDIQTQQTIGSPLPGVPGEEAAPQFTRDGTGLIASYTNGQAYLWDMRPERLLRQVCQVAARRLTRAEWAEFLPGREYDPAC